MWQSKLQMISLGILTKQQIDSEQSFSKYLGSVPFLYDLFIISLIVAAGFLGWYHGRQSVLKGEHGLWGWGNKRKSKGAAARDKFDGKTGF